MLSRQGVTEGGSDLLNLHSHHQYRNILQRIERLFTNLASSGSSSKKKFFDIVAEANSVKKDFVILIDQLLLNTFHQSSTPNDTPSFEKHFFDTSFPLPASSNSTSSALESSPSSSDPLWPETGLNQSMFSLKDFTQTQSLPTQNPVQPFASKETVPQTADYNPFDTPFNSVYAYDRFLSTSSKRSLPTPTQRSQPTLASEQTNTTEDTKNVSWLQICKPNNPQQQQQGDIPTFANRATRKPILKTKKANAHSKFNRSKQLHELSKPNHTPPSQPSEETLRCRIFISNLPSDYGDAEQIRSELEATCGPILHTLWFASRTDGKFYGSGLITFEEPKSAQKALDMNGCTLFGRVIRIEPSRCTDPVKKKPPGCQTVYLNNLSKSITESYLRELFSDCGEMKSVRLLERANKNTNAGFIEFFETDSTTIALQHHGKVIDAYPLHVDYQRYG